VLKGLLLPPLIAGFSVFAWNIASIGQMPGPPGMYVFAPAPPKLAEPLPPSEMVEPPPGPPVEPELNEPVYMMGELPLDIPIAPLTDGEPIAPLPAPPIVLTRTCISQNYYSASGRRYYHRRTVCGDAKPAE
jgi:hypothetical protein